MIKEDLLIVAGIAVAILGAGWYAKRQAGQAIDSAAQWTSGQIDAGVARVEEAWNPLAIISPVYALSPYVPAPVNPGSDQNVIYRGVNAAGSAATGDGSFSLGGWLYDLTHSGV
jgi:hypothetical protein